jgi:membrane protease subunit HflK
MKLWLTATLVLVGLYLASGVYVVRGNEKAVVRRFGRVVRNEVGNVVLQGSGLHYDLPWPLAIVDRVNLNEVRSLTIGATDIDEGSGNLGDFLRSTAAVERSQFLTGDKNILNLQITVQYRISAQNPDDFLFHSESPVDHLRLLAETATADLVARSGVDFVHPLGLVELRQMLTGRMRDLAVKYRLGIEVDDAAISAVYPPPQVKQAFLDVSNARAFRDQSINNARAYAQQMQTKADVEAWQIRNDAEIARRQAIEQARGKSDRFRTIVGRFERHENPQAIRQLTMRRMYLETMEDILRKVAGKVYLDSGQTIDLTIFRDPKE